MCNYKAELNVTKKKKNMTLSDRKVERKTCVVLF